MTCRGSTSSEEEIAAAIDRVLDEDRRKDSRVKESREGSRGQATTKSGEFNENSSASPDAKTAQNNGSDPKAVINYCCCRASVMSRFSLMVMEALRSLERESNTFTISSVDDIVEHIQKNYATNGDVYAQSLTALKQVSSQGFVLEVLKDEYHLVGPLANSMNECLVGRTGCLPGDKSLESGNRRQSDCSLNWRHNLCEPGRDTENRSSADFEEDSSVDVESQETDNCGCATQKRKNEGNSDNLREKRVRRASGDFQGNISMRTRAASQKSRNTRRNQTVDKDSTTEESNDVDDQDFVQEAQSSNSRPQGKKRSEELKEWIQRCQEECKRRTRNRR